MVKFEEVSSLSDFEKLITLEEKSAGPVYVLFFAGPSNKESWCPDCNKAKPIIEDVINSKAPEEATFIHVDVGDRATWKNPESEFRTNDLIKVTNVPTLLRWDTRRSLTEEECTDPVKLESLL